MKPREAMEIEICRIRCERSVTTVYVIHDQTEAMNVSNRIAVMSGGIIKQFGTAEENGALWSAT